MKSQVSFLKVLVLLIPFMIGSIILELGYADLYIYQLSFINANFLTTISFLLVISYHARFAVSFSNNQIIKANWFKINTLIPPVFFIIYTLYQLYFLLFIPIKHNSRYVPGPIRTTDLNFIDIIIILFLIYAVINFLFINNQFIAYKIKKTEDVNKRDLLKTTYLYPMKRIVRFSLFITGGFFILLIIIDITKLLSTSPLR